jgi:hypothetical protein
MTSSALPLVRLLLLGLRARALEPTPPMLRTLPKLNMLPTPQKLRMLSKLFLPDGARFRPERARVRLVSSSSLPAFSPRRGSLVGLVRGV